MSLEHRSLGDERLTTTISMGGDCCSLLGFNVGGFVPGSSVDRRYEDVNQKRSSDAIRGYS